jgi:hypothetical protein
VLEAFRRTWPECLKEAPHFSNVVTAALIVLIENGLTLMHMPRLLTNTEFREQCLERVTDVNVVEFFHDCYDRWGREAPLMRENTLNKIGAFSLNPRPKLMLGQRPSHLDFWLTICYHIAMREEEPHAPGGWGQPDNEDNASSPVMAEYYIRSMIAANDLVLW